MNVEELLERCMSNAGFAKKILEKFRDRMQGDVEKLVDSVVRGESGGDGEAGLGLKGTANLSAGGGFEELRGV